MLLILCPTLLQQIATSENIKDSQKANKALLFNLNKPFILGSGSLTSSEDLMIDCFVSSFRNNYRNSQHFDPCLATSSPVIFNYVYIKSVYLIVTEHVLNKIKNAEQEAQQSRLSQIYKVKDIHKRGHKEDDMPAGRRDKELLLCLVRLFHADPVFAFHNPDAPGWDIQKSSSQIIMGLVNRVLSNSMTLDINEEAAQTLHCFFQADNVEMWNPVAPIATFWEISSHVFVAISDILINHTPKSTQLLKYLKELIRCKNEFLSRHKDHASTGCHIPVCSSAHNKLEEVFLTYLWSSDIDTTMIALSSFGHLCEELDILQSSENISELQTSSNLNVMSELAAEATRFTAGRAALQKKIMALLRQLDRQTPGNVQAWENTYIRWQKMTYGLSNYGKEVQYLQAVRKRTGSSLPRFPSNDIENSLSEWTYMTGFLCSLGVVCLTSYQTLRRYSRVLPSPVQTHNETQSKENSNVARFLKDLLGLLVCSNEKLGVQIRKTVNELIGSQLSPTLYPILFVEIKNVLKTFFNAAGQVIVQETNTLFVDQVIVIMKHILDIKEQTETFQPGNVEAMILTLVRYVRNLPLSVQSLRIKTKLCILVDMVMTRREELLFHQEMKFRNKLVEYLTDWVLLFDDKRQHLPLDLTVLSNELDAAVMKAIASLLASLPLQPEDIETDIVEAKSQLFLKYFTLFMNLMSRCKEQYIADTEGRDTRLSASQSLYQNTILAMSNLLNANIDTGLMYAIGLGYHEDLQTRAVFMEVLTKILQQGTEFNNLADTVLMDRFDKLVQLVTLTGERGELPIAMALASVMPSQQLDELAQVLVTLFDDKHMLSLLLKNVFSLEVRNAESMQILFRGNSLASKVITFCFKSHGSNYLPTLLGPLIVKMYKEQVTYEVDPDRIDKNESLEENRNNLVKLAQEFINKITSSANSLPLTLRDLCCVLRKIVQQRFPNSSLASVGSAIFLRFINPAIISPHLFGIIDETPSDRSRRGLMMLSKILQNLGNHVLYMKEKYMEPFNGFLEANFEKTKRFFEKVSAEIPSKPNDESTTYSFLSDNSVLTLHRLLWDNQEKIGTYLSSRREYKTFGRRPFEKMSTLLAQVGPPDQQRRTFDRKWPTGSRFEEFMARHAENSQDDLHIIRSQNVFYQAGKSKAGNQVFCFISRRFRPDQMNDELLIYHVLLLLEPFTERHWELVADFTHTTLENRFKPSTIVKFLTVVPKATLTNLISVYMYNCSSSLRQYTKYNERLLTPLKGRPSVRICENIGKLLEFIKEEELKLPGSTTSLEEDLQVFTAFRLSTRSNVQIKVGPMSVQITTHERHKVLGYSTILNDVYYASEVKEDAVTSASKKIKPKDVPGTLLNMALLNLGSRDPSLRLAAYNLLCAVTKAFNLKVEERLLEGTDDDGGDDDGGGGDDGGDDDGDDDDDDGGGGCDDDYDDGDGGDDDDYGDDDYDGGGGGCDDDYDDDDDDGDGGDDDGDGGDYDGGGDYDDYGLCIPANNTIFIVGISEKLAAREPKLTLEFLEECINGFMKSNTELKHLCLEYMAPWLPNLTRFLKFSVKDAQRIKMNNILESLINITVTEQGAMNPSVQANIWGMIGKVTELLDTVLDSFLKASASGGLGSNKAEVLADTAAALASANVQVVSSKVIGRLHTLVSKTFISPTIRLEQHLMWDDIAILTRYLLMLSFNDCLDVATHIPCLFHLTTLLISTGPPTIRASIHGLLINIIHSLCTCTYIKFSDETQTLLRVKLAELSSPKFYLLFGISKIKSPAVKAFKATQRGQRFYLRETEGEVMTMPSVETVTDVLLEVMEACMKDIPDSTWLQSWTELATEFAFQFNPALQPRTIVVLGCISKEADDIMALSNYTDLILIESAIMCLTRVQGILGKESKFHKAFFWIAVAVLQLSELSLYPCGLALLEHSLLTLDSHGMFEIKPVQTVLMAVRKEPSLEFHCKQMDHFVGVSFYGNFHFALMAHLVKGVYHPHATTAARAIRILNLMLDITSKHRQSRDKFAVTKENLAYLAALIPVSEDIRSRLKPGTTASTPDPCPLSGSAVKTDTIRGSSLSVDSRVSIVITTTESARSDEVPPEEQAFEWPTECQHLLLDPGVVNDNKTQALLLTTLVMLLEYTTGDVEVGYLYQLLAEASIMYPKVFPVIYYNLDAHLGTVLGHSDDLNTLQAVQTIIHSVTASRPSDDNLRHNFLASFGFTGFSHFTKFKEQSGQNNRAQLFMKFLEAVLEVFGRGTNAIPDRSFKYSGLGNTASAVKSVNLSSSSDDLRSLDDNSNLSTSLTSLPAAMKDLTIPMPFKRAGSSYRPRKISLNTKVKRNMSTKVARTSSLQTSKFL
ncbi:hypothetical protein QZH41_017349 [Actinostola sp. cb2023]|nr:hypothetical protein QZH41_017349 [Actinostola sp. cb2023]